MSLSFIQEMQTIANDESLQEKMKEEDFKINLSMNYF